MPSPSSDLADDPLPVARTQDDTATGESFDAGDGSIEPATASASPPPLPHPPWYRIYAEITSIAWLTFIVIRHAREVLIATSFLQQVEHEAALQEVLRFDDAGIEDATNDESLEQVEPVDERAPLIEHLRADARRVFRVRRLRPKQEAAITTIVSDPACKGKLIVVETNVISLVA